MKSSLLVRSTASLIALICMSNCSMAADAGATDAKPAAAPSAPAPAGWSVQCASLGGVADGGLSCQMQQQVFAIPSGQPIVSAIVQMDAATKAPAMIVRLPLGILLTEGVSLAVDEGKTQSLPIQTCDGQGCYANVPVAAEMLEMLGKGKILNVAFLSVKKEPLAVPVPLAGFQAAYQKIQ